MNAPNAIATITQDIFALRDNFQLVAADKHINFDKEAGFAIQVLSGSQYAMKIAMANRQSVADAVTNVSAIGVSLNPAKKQAYLVPRKDKICLDISYIGLIDLAVGTGSILWAQANVVRENDQFVVNGFDKPPTHGHDPFAGATARGPIKGAYVVVKTPDGEFLTHTMDIAKIYSIRDRSESWKAGGSGPWKSDEEEMIKKTVVKQAYKYWPKTDRTDRLDQAIHMLNTDGEGIHMHSASAALYPADALDDWVCRANGAATEAALTSIWQQGLADIKPSKDLNAYNTFKAAVVARGDVLKKSTPIDVEGRPVEGAEVAA
ncbi:recombinase RecT [Polaromonas sp.]|uniref:recombinase RecT n=1 Tax=Polaromonas sp. TaxID=1869339 RepID=UPI0037503AB0